MNQDIYNKLSLEEIEKFKEYYNKNSNLEIYDNLTINELFNESVLRNPDNIALVKGNEKLTYKDMDILSDKVSLYLREKYNIKENENNGLNEVTISSLMEILRVNHIDFWRCIKKLYSSRYFRDLNNSIFKTSITTAMKVLDEIDSDFFTTTTSICIDYTKPLAQVIIE